MELFIQVHAAAGRLLAIPEGGVEDIYLVLRVIHFILLSYNKKAMDFIAHGL